jgi:hypothetical protein
MAPVLGVFHRASLPYPFCQTRTSTPYAAPSDTRLSSTAFAGSTSDRNARASNKNVTRQTIPSMYGKRP